MAISQECLAQRVREALVARGVSNKQLAAALDIDPSAVSKALSGKRRFTSLELAIIAEQVEVSVQALLSDEATVAPTLAVAARTQPDSAPSHHEVLGRVHEMLELDRLLVDLGFESTPVRFPDYDRALPPAEQGEQLADLVREQVGVGDGDLPGDLTELAVFLEHEIGIDVAFEPLTDGLDGVSARYDGFQLALVSSTVAATRQRWTLAHELGHLAGRDPNGVHVDEDVIGRHTDAETRANAFAAAFLMPASTLRKLPKGYLGEEDVAELLGRFRVSLDALAFRLHNVGVVNAVGRDRIRAMRSSGISMRSGRAEDLQGRNEHRVPTILMRRAMEAYVQAKISVRPLATLLRVEPDLLLQELSPPPPERVEHDGREATPIL